MAEFVIKLADERGRVQEQVQTAATADELKARFIHAGYHVFSVRARGAIGRGRRKVKLEPFLIFNSQFLTLIRAGLPILGSLQMLGKIQKNATFAGQLEDVASRVKTGEALSAAFEAQSGFPLMYTTTLLAGERSGNLTEVLGSLRKLPEGRAHPAQKAHRLAHLSLRTAHAGLRAPDLHVHRRGAAICAALRPARQQIAGSHPRPAQLRQVDAAQHSMAGVDSWSRSSFALYRFSLTERGKDFADGVRIRLPILGKIWLKYQVALFARTLSTLLTGGLPLVPSLETASRSISSRRVSRAVQTSVGTVREGKSLADSLAKTGIFPDLATEMITVGEQTGALPQMLNSMSEFFEEDVATALAAALALIEPAILIVMGVVVVFILISLYLPIFSLGQASGM